MDNIETLENLKDKVRIFCDEREWNIFHTPKDLAIGISTEANELLALFRFKSTKECLEILNQQRNAEAIYDELADVLFFLLRFSQIYEIDLDSVLTKKLQKSTLKYPIELCKGNNKKYTEFGILSDSKK